MTAHFTPQSRGDAIRAIHATADAAGIHAIRALFAELRERIGSTDLADVLSAVEAIRDDQTGAHFDAATRLRKAAEDVLHDAGIEA